MRMASSYRLEDYETMRPFRNTYFGLPWNPSALKIWPDPEQTMGAGLKERLDDSTKMRLGQTQKKRLDVIVSTQHSIAKYLFP